MMSKEAYDAENGYGYTFGRDQGVGRLNFAGCTGNAITDVVSKALTGGGRRPSPHRLHQRPHRIRPGDRWAATVPRNLLDVLPVRARSTSTFCYFRQRPAPGQPLPPWPSAR